MLSKTVQEEHYYLQQTLYLIQEKPFAFTKSLI